MKKIISVLLAIMLSMGVFLTVVGCVGQNKFKVTFDLDGGTLVSGQLVQEVEKSEELVLPKIEKEGWTFIGWDTPISELTKDATVKALWEKNKFTVIFSVANGVFDDNGGALIQTVDKWEDLIAPIFTREGYTLSWDTKFSDIKTDCTVNGVWTAKGYQINFVDESGQPIDGVDAMPIIYGEQVETLPVLPNGAKKFVGWRMPSGETFSVGQIYNYDRDLTLKAEWTDYAKFVIRVNLAGGIGMNIPTTYTEGTGAVINPATRVGYNFKGWLETDSAGIPIPGAEAKNIIQIGAGALGDRYYTATWEVKEYTVYFTSISGTLDKSSMTFTYGQTITELPTVSDNEGKFIGWKYGNNEIKLGDEWLFDMDGIEVKAQFIRKFVFTLNVQGVCGNVTVPCTLPNGTETTIELDEFKTIILPEAKPVDTGEYHFSCWKYIDDSGKANKLASNSVVSESTLKGLDFGDEMTVNIELIAYCDTNWTGYY